MSDSYSILAGKYGYADSERFKNILKLLMNEEEVDIVVSLPADLETLAQRCNSTVDHIAQILAGLYTRGVVFETRKGYQTARGGGAIARCNLQRSKVR